jgi:hypothetical protein
MNSEWLSPGRWGMENEELLFSTEIIPGSGGRRIVRWRNG